MARFTYDAGTVAAEGLEKLGRPMIRRIVEAGADAAVEHMRQRITELHRRTGDMAESVAKAEYKETLGGGSQLVYPQGADRRGVDNAKKAYVINYGRGKKQNRDGSRSRMGDHFIDRDPDVERIVREAMERESDRAMSEAGAS